MITADRLRGVMQTSIVLTELQHNQVQVRLVQILLSMTMVFAALDPAALILGAHTSLTHQVALLAYSPTLLAYSFVALAVLMLPHALMQAFCPAHPWRRGITQLACFALLLASLQWMYLAYLSLALDIGAITFIWIKTAIGALGYSLIMALSLNAERARQYFDCHQ